MRLFVGLELSESCKHSLEELDPQIEGLRWLRADQLHLTLSFIGNVGTEKKDELIDQLNTVLVPPFYLPLHGIGVFESRGVPSVVWVGVGKGHPHLFALHQRVQDAVLHAGLEPDLRSFHPHVSVGRPRGISRERLRPFLRKHAETEHGLFHVDKFVLYSSRTSSEGSDYQVEFTRLLSP